MTSSRPVPRRRFLRVVGMLSMALFAVCLASPATSFAATPPSAAAGDVFFSPKASVIQAKSPAGMRTFLSTDHPEYSLQSYVWAGSLVDVGGRVNTFAFCMQRNNESIDGSPLVPVVTSAALFNRSSDPGFVVGGLAGVADLTLPLSLTTRPWSVRAQSFTPGQPPDFIDVRVVEGVLGKKGAVYEFTSFVPNGADGCPCEPVPHALCPRQRHDRHHAVGLWSLGVLPAVDLPGPARRHHERLRQLRREVPRGNPRPDDQPGGLLLHHAASQGAALLREPGRSGRQQGIGRLALVRQRRTAVRRRGRADHLQRCERGSSSASSSPRRSRR